MLVNVGFSTPEVRSLVWESLSQKAQSRRVELVEITHSDSLFFTQGPFKTKVLTLVSLNSEMTDCDHNLSELSENTLDLILSWHIERQSLEAMREHRHTLGNLIVILLSKMMRLEGKAPQTEIEGLEKLHSRFSDLYAEFEKINVRRFKY